jgi:predicted phosphohydrolase
MGRLFAIADLHLSGTGQKPMDVFGDLWRDHDARIAAAWDGSVGPADAVLLPGDLSWARDLREAAPDLAWIGARPGRKLLLRGNHDGWWSSLRKVRAALPAGCDVLQNDAHEVGHWVVIGARGWTDPSLPGATAADERVFRRELERLQRSVADADARFGRSRPRLAMLHYPPWLAGHDPSEVVRVLEGAGVRMCLYGHLHGDDHRLARTGVHRGIDYRFVAADALGFSPVEIASLHPAVESGP